MAAARSHVLKLKYLYETTSNVYTLREWLTTHSLLHDYSGTCDRCRVSNVKIIREQRNTTDQGVWRCSNKQCRKQQTIRTRSFFKDSRMTLAQIVEIIYMWAYNQKVSFTTLQCDASPTTIIDWYNFCRDVCVEIVLKNSKKIGGVGVKVQIDESQFGKQKYHRGRGVAGQWVFGGIQEGDIKKVFLAPVAKRDTETLLALIKENIEPGSIIVSDCWKAYNCVSLSGYEHMTVNHSKNFVDPESGVCTNLIENTWSCIKRTLNANGTSKDLFGSYLAEWLYRRQFINPGDDCFMKFLSHVAELYQKNSDPYYDD